MRPPESFIAQPIRSLQTMLQVIAQVDNKQPTLIPDGYYGPQTATAVTAFQRNHGLPITGVADQRTWEAVSDVYENAMVRISPAQPIEILLEPEQIIKRGDKNPNIPIIQAILTVLSETYSSVTPPGKSGIWDEASAVSLTSFQEIAGLPQTGNLDRITWKYLALHYPLASNSVSRSDQSCNC